MRFGLAILAGLLCAAASPPAWVPGGEFLVLAGLAAFYACATSSRRPYLAGYCIGLIRLGFVAWSLRHVAGGAYVAIVLLGAVYDLLVVVWVLRVGRYVPKALAFGLGLAATEWLRAHMPEIPYPHGQSGHALFAWPALLGPVRWGGEVAINLLIAWTAAACVDWFRSWRVGEPEWRVARRGALIPLGLWLIVCVVPPPSAGDEQPGTVDLVAIEPGREVVFDRVDPMHQLGVRLVAPTGRVARPGTESPPDLVIWPESSLPPHWDRGSPLRLADGVRLLGGIVLNESGDDYSAAMLYRADGTSLGWQEKQVPVPAAERLPWIAILPQFVFDWATGIVGYPPRLMPGRWRSALQTEDGVRFGTLICFDNAFDSVARRHVAENQARFLAVLSNEAWYQQEAELDQMVAMSVFRALETGTPLIRSTIDGRTVLVGADGSIRSPSPISSERADDPKILRSEVPLGPGALGPLAWLHRLLPWIVLLSGLAAAGWHRRN